MSEDTILEIPEKTIPEPDAFTRELLNLERRIMKLVRSVNMVTKEQLWCYFAQDDQDFISQAVNCLLEENCLFAKETEDVYRHNDRLVADGRLFDPDYYTTKKVDGHANTYADMMKFSSHIENLDACRRAFWIFLDLMEFGAEHPVSIESSKIDCMTLAFTAKGHIFEILTVEPNKDSDLAILNEMERYKEADEYTTPYRIIVIENKDQIELIKDYKVKGVAYYVIYTKETDNREYITV